MVQISREDVRRALRPDGRRPGPARRHRPVDRGRAGPHLRRRGGGLRRRQVDPRVDGASRCTTSADGAPDTVITNAVVLDHWGIVRADVGIRDGRIVALGRSRQPRHRRRRRTRRCMIGPSHRRHLRRGQDPHRRRHRLPRALPLPVADRRGAGHRADHARRRRHRAVGGHQGHHRHARARGTWSRSTASLDAFPVNLLLLGKGNTVSAAALEEQALAGAGGYKVHEDWGSTPAAIDAALRGADEWGLQVALHSDSLNEAGYVASPPSRRSPAGRIRAFHVEGAGGGHAPDILTHRRAAERASPARPTRRCRTPSTPSPSTSTC